MPEVSCEGKEKVETMGSWPGVERHVRGLAELRGEEDPGALLGWTSRAVCTVASQLIALGCFALGLPALPRAAWAVECWLWANLEMKASIIFMNFSFQVCIVHL